MIGKPDFEKNKKCFFDKSRGKADMAINVASFREGARGFPFRTRARDKKNQKEAGVRSLRFPFFVRQISRSRFGL